MHRSEAAGGRAATMTISLFLGGLFSLACALLVLLLGAAFISGGVLDQSWSERVTSAACVIGCLMGGAFTCRRWGARLLFAGTGTGLAGFLMILAVSFVSGGGVELGGRVLAELACCACGGAAAGALCAMRRNRGRRRSVKSV